MFFVLGFGRAFIGEKEARQQVLVCVVYAPGRFVLQYLIRQLASLLSLYRSLGH